MKKMLAIVVVALGVSFGGSAAADPEVVVRPVDERACAQTDPKWSDVPGPARPGIPHDRGHKHEGTGEEFGCHHATGTEDPNPNP